MPVSEDGVPYGSIDVNELDSVEPKTDEAKAAVDALKTRIQEGQDQANADAQRLAEQAAAQDPTVTEVPQDNRDIQGKPTGEDVKPAESKQSQSEQEKQQAAKKASSSHDKG